MLISIKLQNSTLTQFRIQEPQMNPLSALLLCLFACFSLRFCSFPITAQRHAGLMKWRLPPSAPNSVRNRVKASQRYFSVVLLSFQMSHVILPFFDVKADLYSFPQTQEKVTERVVRLCGDVLGLGGSGGVHRCRDSVSPGLSTVIWPNPTGFWLHVRDYGTVSGGLPLCLHYLMRAPKQSEFT